jgi:hypothetical protein
VTEAPKKPTTMCPKGHPVQTAFGRSRCSKVRCGQDAAAERGPSTLDLDALAKLDPAEAAFQSRQQMAGVPKGLTGDKATEWAQAKMADLLPEAVANVAYDLRYGTDKQREAATERVLRANGMDRKDSNSGGQHGLIVLQLGAGDEKIPWLQRMQKPTGDK